MFKSSADLKSRIHDPALNITEDHVIVLQGAGPIGAGIPESGMLPIPNYLLEQGVRDMVRISDARMSGTAYGTVVLHVSPEAAAGGPLALVQNGDFIELDVEARKLHLDVSDEELARRRAQWQKPELPPQMQRGWVKLYVDHVQQANQGADLDFLVGKSGPYVPKDNH